MPEEDEIRAAIARGQADVLASNVTPHPAVARLMHAPPVADAEPPAERAVVWADAARAALVAYLEGSAGNKARAALVSAIDRTARGLGLAARGVAGPAPHTYEKIVPDTPIVLAFELVTWTKAGEVIAILHLFEAARDGAREGPLWT